MFLTIIQIPVEQALLQTEDSHHSFLATGRIAKHIPQAYCHARSQPRRQVFF